MGEIRTQYRPQPVITRDCAPRSELRHQLFQMLQEGRRLYWWREAPERRRILVSIEYVVWRKHLRFCTPHIQPTVICHFCSEHVRGVVFVDGYTTAPTTPVSGWLDCAAQIGRFLEWLEVQSPTIWSFRPRFANTVARCTFPRKWAVVVIFARKRKG